MAQLDPAAGSRNPQRGFGAGLQRLVPVVGLPLWGASVAPPLVFSPVEPMAAQTTDSAEFSERRVDAGHSARLPALIAALSSPDREIVVSRVGAGMSIPDIVAILGVTPGVVGLAQHQALGALRPAATAHGHPPAASGWCCCHTPGPSPLTPDPTTAHRTGPGVNPDDPPRRPQAHGDDATGAITLSGQWHDAELAMKVARHSFDSWLIAVHQDTPSLALRHACHAHTALHEAARAITALIDTFRVQAAALITSPTQGTDTPAQRR
jgi:hypothetical protein